MPVPSRPTGSGSQRSSAEQPDDERLEGLERRADAAAEEELDTHWADPLVEAVIRLRLRDPVAAGVRAREPIHRLGRRLDDDAQLRACVRRALVPWALGPPDGSP